MGAVDFSECPNKQWSNRGKCRCGVCRVCGFAKHTAIHGPVMPKQNGMPSQTFVGEGGM